MQVFLTGATGALGRRLVPLLISAGHDVTGMTRSKRNAEWLRSAGADAAVADALDADAVRAAVLAAEPEVVIHQLTSLTDLSDFRNIDRAFAQTNRLRTEGLDILLDAARAAGARRFVAQSYCGWPYATTGGPVKTEDDPLEPNLPARARESLAAIQHVEETVPAAADMEGVVLRYGGFYGPGTSITDGGETLEAVRKRKFPLVGSGAGVWSFVHIDDAATATLAAVERGEPGVYNVVDDDPAPVREWLPTLAKAAGAKPPRRVPAWVGRLAAGAFAVRLMTEGRGGSNARAKRALGWQPAYASWRDGFARGLRS
jgi:2-alkyl-3-oxoalkanoate reductase